MGAGVVAPEGEFADLSPSESTGSRWVDVGAADGVVFGRCPVSGMSRMPPVRWAAGGGKAESAAAFLPRDRVVIRVSIRGA